MGKAVLSPSPSPRRFSLAHSRGGRRSGKRGEEMERGGEACCGSEVGKTRRIEEEGSRLSGGGGGGGISFAVGPGQEGDFFESCRGEKT